MRISTQKQVLELILFGEARIIRLKKIDPHSRNPRRAPRARRVGA